MDIKERKKICTHCDGRIPFDAPLCLYCGTQQEVHAPPFADEALQKTTASLYSPPYCAKGTQPMSSEKKSEGYRDVTGEKRFNTNLGAPALSLEESEESTHAQEKSVFWPMLLMSVGSNLLTIGLLQLFFSDNGFLRLEWNSSYWFIYCLSSLPLFFFGFRKANALNKE